MYLRYHGKKHCLVGKGGARKFHGGEGLASLELPSKICELKCYKLKLLNLFSNYKPNVFIL